MLFAIQITIKSIPYPPDLYQNPYQNERRKQRSRMVLNECATLPKPLKLLHFFTLNPTVLFALNLWHSIRDTFPLVGFLTGRRIDGIIILGIYIFKIAQNA